MSPFELEPQFRPSDFLMSSISSTLIGVLIVISWSNAPVWPYDSPVHRLPTQYVGAVKLAAEPTRSPD
jgi:hypothetical protein